MSENLYDNTMKKLKESILSQGSIRSLAERLELNPSTVSRWFAEGRSPDFRGLATILEHLGVDIIFPADRRAQQQDVKHSCQSNRIVELEKEISVLKEKLIRKDGAIEVLKEQVREYQNSAMQNNNKDTEEKTKNEDQQKFLDSKTA